MTPAGIDHSRVPSYAEHITIRQLLQHQAGLPDYEPLVPDGTVPRVRDREVVDLLIQQASLDFAPGSQYYYSNSAYAVLAIIVEEVSGLTFEEFLRARIFEPSDMPNTVGLVEGINTVPSRALGHTVEIVASKRPTSPTSVRFSAMVASTPPKGHDHLGKA